MSHTAQQENLEPTITVRQALRQQQDLLANCFLWKIRIAVQQRNSCPRAGGRSIPAAAWLSLSCRRIALTRGLPLAVLMSSLPLAASVQSFPPGWVLWAVLESVAPGVFRSVCCAAVWSRCCGVQTKPPAAVQLLKGSQHSSHWQRGCLENEICGASLRGRGSAREQHSLELSPSKPDCSTAQCCSASLSEHTFTC